MSKLALIVVFGWIGISAPALVVAERPLIVGVLEDVVAGNLSPGMATAHVRIVFKKQGTEWVAFPTDFSTWEQVENSDKLYPSAVRWAVAFNGKRVGTIDSENPGPVRAYGDVGTHRITTPANRIPRIASGAADFSHFGNSAKSRPLVLVSTSNCNDPEGWKPTTLTRVEKAVAIKNFRRQFPALEQCDKPEEQPVHMIPYRNEEVVLLRAYRSRGGEVLFGQRLDDKRSNCGFFDDKLFVDYWYVMEAGRRIRSLGSEMMPIDAVDLDDDGHSEWIFQTARGEDEEGYALYYDNFAKQARFRWTYH